MSDKIIRFPGGGPASAKPGKDAAPAKTSTKPPAGTIAGPTGILAGPTGKLAGPTGKKGKQTESAVDGDALTEDQRKAVGIVLSGMPFVVIGIKATPSGADFFTAVSGEGSDLRNAEPHLAGVIERALEKKGF